jgi:mannose-6-phosphate isomerase-like protein (cupin superfamily)
MRTGHYTLQAIRDQRISDGNQYHEFLRVPDLSMGIYEIPAGGTDPQRPHGEDETYFVIAGKSKMFLDDQDVDVTAGDTIYVAKGVEHRFHSIEEDLSILVFFAPAEGSAGHV